MLSDFGTSRDMMQTPRARSGNTGTSVLQLLHAKELLTDIVT